MDYIALSQRFTPSIGKYCYNSIRLASFLDEINRLLFLFILFNQGCFSFEFQIFFFFVFKLAFSFSFCWFSLCETLF